MKNDFQSNVRGSSFIMYIYMYIKGSLILANIYYQASKHNQKRRSFEAVKNIVQIYSSSSIKVFI